MVVVKLDGESRRRGRAGVHGRRRRKEDEGRLGQSVGVVDVPSSMIVSLFVAVGVGVEEVVEVAGRVLVCLALCQYFQRLPFSDINISTFSSQTMTPDEWPEARLLNEQDDDEDIDSADDEELDSDAAFDESDEDRFAGFFSSKV